MVVTGTSGKQDAGAARAAPRLSAARPSGRAENAGALQWLHRGGRTSSGLPHQGAAGGMVQSTEEALVLGAVRPGDEAAFGALTERYRRQLQVRCYRMVGSACWWVRPRLRQPVPRRRRSSTNRASTTTSLTHRSVHAPGAPIGGTNQPCRHGLPRAVHCAARRGRPPYEIAWGTTPMMNPLAVLAASVALSPACAAGRRTASDRVRRALPLLWAGIAVALLLADLLRAGAQQVGDAAR